MGAFPGNDLLRFGSCWALLLLWAAPEKFFPWLDREPSKDAALSQPQPAPASNDGGETEPALSLPELAPPRADRPTAGSRVANVAAQNSDSTAAGGSGKDRPPALADTRNQRTRRPFERPRDDLAPPASPAPRVSQAMLTALSELGPPSA